MDTVSQQVAGHFRDATDASSHPSLSVMPRPYVEARVYLGTAWHNVPLLIDTGADFTTLQYEDVSWLVGRSRLEIDFSNERNTVSVSGIGYDSVRCTVLPVGLQLIDTDGNEITFKHTILIASPTEETKPAEDTIKLPSLLGRDVLRYFDLHLSYDPPSPTLTLND